MTDSQDLTSNTMSDMENPLLWPILDILKKQPTDWKVHKLAGKLSEEGYLPQLDASPNKDLFKRNFLLMNALYQLQESLYPKQWLQVEAMDIVLFEHLPTSEYYIDHRDPLREYYSDWQNYEADSDEVKRLMNEFWQRYRQQAGHHSNSGNLTRNTALKLFELKNDATNREIRKRWRQLALRWHPDRENGDTERFRQLCEAWHVLRTNS